MEDIIVKMNKLEGSASEIKSSMHRLGPVSDDILNIANNLAYTSTGADEIRRQLRNINEMLATSRKAGTLVGANLEQIAGFYRQAEKDNLNQAGVLRGNVDAATAMVAAAAAANGAMSTSLKDWMKSISDAIRSLFISTYERANPEHAKLVNDFLNSGRNNHLTEQEKNDLKMMIYTAPEPYKSIYLKNLDKFTIGNADEDGGAYYDPNNRTVNYHYSDDEYDSYNDNKRGPYTTVFHECGHAIDDVADLTNVNGSDTSNFTYHSDAMGKDVKLIDAIKYDVYDNPNNPHSVRSMARDIMQYNKSTSGANVNNVVNAFKNGGYDNLSPAEQNLFDSIKTMHSSGLNKNRAHCESVTDVYGGVSHNELYAHGYHHDNKYWDSRDVHAPSRELWAEYFSYNMADGTENLSALREYFPEASKVMDAYAQSLAK